MPRHLLQESVDRLAAPPAASATGSGGGLHTDTLLILTAVLCFLLCLVGMALVAWCSRLCNPSAFSVDAPVAMAAKAQCMGIEKAALQSLPTVTWAATEQREQGEEAPECAICLAEFACGDEVRVLPPCGHGFHAACVDVWLLSSSTCPSCRRALLLSPSATKPPTTCSRTATEGRCRFSKQGTFQGLATC